MVAAWGVMAVGCASVYAPAQLDPARVPGALRMPPASQLTEEFIWTAGDAAALDPAMQAKVRGQNDKIAPHFFRARFEVGAVPREATLYLAGPRAAAVYINGREVLRFADDGKGGEGIQRFNGGGCGGAEGGDECDFGGGCAGA